MGEDFIRGDAATGEGDIATGGFEDVDGHLCREFFALAGAADGEEGFAVSWGLGECRGDLIDEGAQKAGGEVVRDDGELIIAEEGFDLFVDWEEELVEKERGRNV